MSNPDDNFFDLGGGSLAAAQLVARIRQRDPEFTVADIYAHPRLGAMAEEVASRIGDRSAGEVHAHRAADTAPDAVAPDASSVSRCSC